MQSSTTSRIVNFLSYLSILFLPVVFPLIVWIIARARDDPSIPKNARKAFWSQIFQAGALFGVLFTFALLIALLLFIYNIAMAVKMLLGRE